MAYSIIQSATFAVVSLLLCLLTITIFTHSVVLHDAHPTADYAGNREVLSPRAIIGDKEEAILEALWPEDGQDASFFMSLNSCVDGCEASQDESDEDGRSTKVGLLAPPGKMSRAFYWFCKEVIRHISEQKTGQGSTKIHWIPTHHLPAVRTEYTHIVRFANVPLLLAAGDALQAVMTVPESAIAGSQEIRWQDINEATKLLISWHCQLSNMVDDGTIPLVTISMEELEQDPSEQETMLIDFLRSPNAVNNDVRSGSSGSGSGSGSGDLEEEPITDAAFLKNAIARIKSILKQVNRVALKEAKKGLVTLTKQTIKESLRGVEGCPAEKGLWEPSRPLPRRVYSFLKDGSANDDIELCRGQVAVTITCQLLEQARMQIQNT